MAEILLLYSVAGLILSLLFVYHKKLEKKSVSEVDAFWEGPKEFERYIKQEKEKRERLQQENEILKAAEIISISQKRKKKIYR